MNYEQTTDAVILESLEKIKKLERVIDMQSAMIEGMRRIVAIARISNKQREDIRLTHALADYDKCKIITATGTGSR